MLRNNFLSSEKFLQKLILIYLQKYLTTNCQTEDAKKVTEFKMIAVYLF